MVKPAHVPSRAQLSEHSCSEDDDDVLFAVSNAHLTGPFSDVLDFLYDVTCTESSGAVTGIISCSSSSIGRNSGHRFVFIFATSVYSATKHRSRTSVSKVKVKVNVNLYSASS